MNKKFRNLLLFLLIAVSLVFSSCSTSKNNVADEMTVHSEMVESTTEEMKSESVNDYDLVQGVFVSADKYGNMMTSITASDLKAAGITYGDMVDVKVDGVNYTCPVVSTYSDVDVGNFLIRVKNEDVYFSINYGNCQKKTGAKENMAVSIVMNEQGAYLLEYETRHLEKSEERSDYSSDEMFANFRKVNTSNIKDGSLYRSCNPALGDARAPYADKLASDVNIKTIVNLADSKESFMQNVDPDSWYMSMYEKGEVILLDMDVDYSGVEFGQSLAKGFKFMAAGEAPFLVHCNEGKDRAGFANVILEALMGASLEEITADYMMSYYNYYGVVKDTAQYDYIANTPHKMLETISNGVTVTDDNLSSIAYDYMIRNGVTASEILEIMGKLM